MSSSDVPSSAVADLSPLKQNPKYARMANALRVLAMDAVEKAGSGHPGMPMGMADAATALWAEHLKFDPAEPHWPDRDRFVLSAGHGSMLLYGLLHLTGYPKMTLEELKNYRVIGSQTPGHPEFGHTPGVETTTGPLGQGLATAVGMALAERMMNARYGDAVVDHRTYVVAGDGCLMEGISHEALSLAGHLKLDRLTVLWDNNTITIDGGTDLSVNDDQVKRFEAHGWHVQSVDGQDTEAVSAAIAKAKLVTDKPSMIACRTTIGFGAPKKAGTAAAHGAALGAEEVAGARKKLGWNEPPFVIPDDIRARWREIGGRGAALRKEWQTRLDAEPADKREAFDRQVRGELAPGWTQALKDLTAHFAADKPKIATRVASGQVLEALAPKLDELIGGSADLTPSNNTKAKVQTSVTPENFGGSYIHYGIREFGMAAAMNGLAVHGGFVPYGGTFLTFSDYARPAIRLSSIMGIRVIYVMTHDSIGLGEDGPTHQPVEHLAALRAMPNLLVFRPADAVETAECWQLALEHKDRPSLLALSRQGVPAIRTAETISENRSARGAYVLLEASGARKATILSTGSEIALAVQARETLEKEGIPTAVVSMPCWALFEAQDEAYRREVLGPVGNRVAIEAAARLGWDRWIGGEGRFIGMHGFGASGEVDQVYKHFGITAEAVVEAVKAGL